MLVKGPLLAIGAVGVVQAALLVGLFAVHDGMPPTRARPLPQAAAAAPAPAAVTAAATPTAPLLPAQRIANKLIKAVPAGTGLAPTRNRNMAASVSWGPGCDPVWTPVAFASSSLAPASGRGGASAQVHVVSTGLGGALLGASVREAERCRMETLPLPIGDEGFAVYAPFGEPTVAFRFGDVIGVISTAGRDMPDVRVLAQKWAAAWPRLIPKNCAPVAIASAARSPFSGDYRGWERQRKLTLASDEVAARASAAMALRLAGGKTSRLDGRPPTSPKPARQPDTDLPWYPDYLQVALADAPELVPAPEFPAPPQRSDTISVRVADPVGPGCGWSFTGMSAPVFDAEREDRLARARTFEALSVLRAATVNDVLARARYQAVYEEHTRSIEAISQWRQQQVRRIAQAWWQDYDERYRRYQELLSAWGEEYRLWQIADAECQARRDQASAAPAPTPVVGASPPVTAGPTPNATPAPMIVCPDAPARPLPPAAPGLPRR